MTPERWVGALSPAPDALADGRGHPRFGTFQGELPRVDLKGLRGPWDLGAPLRWSREKRWTFTQVVTPEIVAVFAIVDMTYASNAYATVVDLKNQAVVYDEAFLGLPGTRVEVSDAPGRGLHARFRRLHAQLSLSRRGDDDAYDVDVSVDPPVTLPAALARRLRIRPKLSWNGTLVTQGASPALTVVAPVPAEAGVNVTQKRAALRSTGTLQVGDRSWSLDGGVAGVDYTHGYLARHTAWRWAMGNGRLADGTRVGFNLVDGINDAHPDTNENAVWVGDVLLPLGRARFRFQREDPTEPWFVETVDGAVTLRFQPLHVHSEIRDFKLVRSRFLQPLGLFSGTIRVGDRVLEVRELGGVTEDQDILW